MSIALTTSGDGKKRQYQGAIARLRPDQMTLTLSRCEVVEIEARIASLGLKGPSAFFRRLLSEARGARCPVVTKEAGR